MKNIILEPLIWVIFLFCLLLGFFQAERVQTTRKQNQELSTRLNEIELILSQLVSREALFKADDLVIREEHGKITTKF